jgi:hypothetical protein
MGNSALSKQFPINTASTTSATFQVDSANTGPKLKNSSGVMQIRDSADAAFAKLSVLTPTADENATTKLYVDARGFIDRGNPTAYDYNETGSKAVLNTDGTWRDLDLSAIVPAGAKAVLMHIDIADDSTGSQFFLRKNGNSNAYNVVQCNTMVANQLCPYEVIVSCDTNRVIEYNGANVAFIYIRIVVKGWFI